MKIRPKCQAVLNTLTASPHALTAAQLAMMTGQDPKSLKYTMNRLMNANLVHVVGKKKVYGGLPNLYKAGPALVVNTGADILAGFVRAAKAQMEQRA